ncbi:dienelactone hydrolase family protein [Frigoriglobus tundricola]|uniref:Putative 1: dienelactone hydrolase n=1 Tax=Frigoriglobus tundricola TaxID=2774151 RepID=A0A6M5YUC4_9BACT|nr:dienelactone hydrolase family protein [Frigoriglobus tundricola]QJW97675.1 putative 1: dienelactone hydrolase [Frigoriglobus tundricola]
MTVTDSAADLPTPTGPMRTYFYAPHDPHRTQPRPGLVLYSEIFQQTPPVRRLAVTFASLGYLVAVPEVYHAHEPPGCVLGYDDDGKTRGNTLKQIIPMSDFDDDARVVVDALRGHSGCTGRVGAVGICLGGHLAFRAALLPEVRATACFYPTDLHSGTLGKGGGADSLARAKEIRGELLMVFGRQDPHVPTAGRRAIYDALDAAGVWFTWHEFNAAHAFLRDEGERYDPATARLGIGLAADLFGRSL